MVPLGRTGLSVSRLGLGLASIGGLFAPVPAAQAAATVDRAWELGVRLYDTAPVYGYGRSEAHAGAALAPRPRGQYVLCTKVGRLIEPGGPDTQPIWADPPPGVGPRLDHTHPAVLRSAAESLDRLGLDRVDVLHIHDPDEDYPTAVTEAYRALAELRRAGVIGALSLGVNHADVAARFLRDAPPPGPDCVLLAGRYTLLVRRPEGPSSDRRDLSNSPERSRGESPGFIGERTSTVRSAGRPTPGRPSSGSPGWTGRRC
ncbi:aldo/keto reductase [Streptomyces sp. NPDC005970]|uniref:aldo/keto reductase n=1 Tax=Streptomyces sp. NPDC005970 TaxID=3156723 RepID=UPI0033E97DFD